jgi:hypothetical protein
MFKPLPVKWLKHCRYAAFLLLNVFFLSLVNPVVIAINFWFLWDKLTVTTDQNLAALPIKLIPVWLAAGMGIYAAISSILFLVIWAVTRLPFSRIAYINLMAHVPFLPFLLFSQLLMFLGIEWNLAGFIIAPVFILMAAILIPASLLYAACLIRKSWREQASRMS